MKPYDIYYEEYEIDFATILEGQLTKLICITDLTDMSDMFVVRFKKGKYLLGKYMPPNESHPYPHLINEYQWSYFILNDALNKLSEIDGI